MCSYCKASGNVRVLGTPATVTYAGTVAADSTLTLAYEYESESETVPEPTTDCRCWFSFWLGVLVEEEGGEKSF